MDDVLVIEKPLTKICKGECKQELTLDHYHISKLSKYGRYNICKPCRSDISKKTKNTARTEGEKICNGSLCNNQSKPVAEFHKHKGHNDGLSSQCNVCVQYDQNNLKSTFDGFITNLLGTTKQHCLTRAKKLEVLITVEDVKNLYHQQQGKCALTGHVLTHTTIDDDDTHHNESVKHRWNISIDRIDSSKGYTIDNIQLVGAIINRIKTDLPNQDLIELYQKMAKNN